METAKTKVTKGKDYAFEQYDMSGANKSEVAFSNSVMKETAPASQTAQYIRVYLNNQRQGNAKAKGRSEVAGTTKKIYKQKGTGKARHGSMRAPIFKGGGVVGGPLTKEYSLSINKKQKKQVLFSAIRSRITDGAVMGLLVDAKEKPKTKAVAEFLKKMKTGKKSVLFVLPVERMESFVLSIRNVRNASYTIATNVNAYEVLSAGKIIFINNAYSEFEKHFSA